ncbi:acetylxylan esterase A-like protein [Emericellopsis cladophorae]|uniref:Carboxylic ester hydrolase n=1 Tax=Emericellopsis cladophorae TaxID=2686198 RepID=A0A9P9Y589_9HYPO|nr:acetylxylan esterase A-like protein [Emericellopsis cladophorae]KAI6783323.1 acetylxylan esterase A-like protein [Emericellopsis cladophorae]
MKTLAWASTLLGLASAAQLQQVSDFGSNPSNVRMYVYKPDNLPANPPLIVAVHWCSGTAQAYYSGSQYANLADQHGFIVVYPESPYSGGCWDVSSDASLTHEGGGDTQGIASMVKYSISEYGVDASRVFVTGTSSGAMMTNVLAATYPDLFQAGSVYAGVPAGCFYTGTVNGWNSTCSGGNSIATPEQWASIVHDMHPGCHGEYPRMYIYHGSEDAVLYPQNYDETIKQWAGVFGYDPDAPIETSPNDPASPYTKSVYGDKLVGALGAGVSHNLPRFEQEDMEWFGIV